VAERVRYYRPGRLKVRLNVLGRACEAQTPLDDTLAPVMTHVPSSKR
jgi:hypothetical protein